MFGGEETMRMEAMYTANINSDDLEWGAILHIM